MHTCQAEEEEAKFGLEHQIWDGWESLGMYQPLAFIERYIYIIQSAGTSCSLSVNFSDQQVMSTEFFSSGTDLALLERAMLLCHYSCILESVHMHIWSTRAEDNLVGRSALRSAIPTRDDNSASLY